MSEDRQDREGRLGVARAAAASALAALEAHRDRIDNLNVYPVPDGDTGTNMALTVRATCDGLEDGRCETAADVARAVTRACLMGARGNSGVILSQLVRGAAESLAGARALDGESLARALRAASDAGYAAVRNPQEGTILTVARELAEHAEELASRDVSLAEALRELVAHGERALARTPEQLDVLKEAGVVDAGGAGLLEIVRGIAAHVAGEPLPQAREAATDGLPIEAIHRERSRFRYCTSFFVEGEDVDPDSLERELGELGDSLLVVGARGAVKVHVHTDDPGRALAAATSVGVLEEVDVKNMHAQAAEREERLAGAVDAAACEVVAVVAGAGNRRLFESLGARVVAGGQTMNPPTSALVAAIEEAAADEVLVLPNNANVVLTAEHAAAVASKRAIVVPTRTIQAGLAALVPFDPVCPAEENAKEMSEAAAGVRAGAVTRASRSTVVGELAVEEGQFLGLVEAEPVAAGPVLEEVAREVLGRLLDRPADVLTILLGDGAASADELRREVAAAHPGLEIEVHDGGQPHYPLLFAVE